MKVKKAAIIAALCAIAMAVCTGVYSRYAVKMQREGGGQGGGQGGRGEGRGGSAVSVRTEKVKLTTLTEYVETNGDISAVNSVAVYPSMGGKVASAAVSLGDNVVRNQLVMRIDPSEPGSYYALSPIFAPISGTVISTPLKIGTKVTTSTAVLTIGDISRLEMTAYIAERDVAMMKTGLKADVSLEAWPGEVFTATVTKVSPVVDAVTRTKEVKLAFDKINEKINAGMFGQVKLYTRVHPDIVAVPQDAVVNKGDYDAVFVVQGDTAVSHEVVTGVTVDSMVEIVSGITAGDEVVVDGGRSLSDGSKVLAVGKGSENRVKEGSLGGKASTKGGAADKGRESKNSGIKNDGGINTKNSNAKGGGSKASGGDKAVGGTKGGGNNTEKGGRL